MRVTLTSKEEGVADEVCSTRGKGCSMRSFRSLSAIVIVDTQDSWISAMTYDTPPRYEPLALPRLLGDLM
jgi:hypothetical protein